MSFQERVLNSCTVFFKLYSLGSQASQAIVTLFTKRNPLTTPANPWPLKTWILLIFLSLSTCSCALWNKKDSQKKAQLYLKIGTSYFAKGDYPNALNQLIIAARHDPKNPVVQHNLGLSYLVRERYQKAEQHLRKAIKLEANYTEARNNLARVLMELSLYNEAIEELKVAREDLTFPYPEKTLTHLGIAYFKLSLFKKARQLFTEALTINPKDCAPNHFLGRSHRALAEYVKAVEFFNKAIIHCQNHNFDEPLYFSALTHYQIGKAKEAISLINTLIHKFPKGKYVHQAHRFLEITR